jgi:hypothetical protein
LEKEGGVGVEIFDSRGWELGSFRKMVEFPGSTGEGEVVTGRRGCGTLAGEWEN